MSPITYLKTILWIALSSWGLSSYGAGPAFGQATTSTSGGGPHGGNCLGSANGIPYLSGDMGYFSAPACDLTSVFGVSITGEWAFPYTYKVVSMDLQTPTMPPGLEDLVFAWPFESGLNLLSPDPIVLNQSYNMPGCFGGLEDAFKVYFGYTRCSSLLPGFTIPYGDYYVDLNIEGTYFDFPTQQNLPYSEVISFHFEVVCGPSCSPNTSPFPLHPDIAINQLGNTQLMTIVNAIEAAQNGSSRQGLAQVPNEVQIYPNPVRDYAHLQLNFPTKSGISMELFDLNGRLVKTIWEDLWLDGGSQVLKISLRDLSPGIYLYQLNLNGEFQSGKILKE